MGEAKIKKEAAVVEKTAKDRVNDTLDEAKNKFELALVIGVNEKGQLDISTNVPQFHVMQWLLNKAVFELFIAERNDNAAQQAATAVEEVSAVVDG